MLQITSDPKLAVRPFHRKCHESFFKTAWILKWYDIYLWFTSCLNITHQISSQLIKPFVLKWHFSIMSQPFSCNINQSWQCFLKNKVFQKKKQKKTLAFIPQCHRCHRCNLDPVCQIASEQRTFFEIRLGPSKQMSFENVFLSVHETKVKGHASTLTLTYFHILWSYNICAGYDTAAFNSSWENVFSISWPSLWKGQTSI